MPNLDTQFDMQLRKDTGAHYTPTSLADFVAAQILDQLETRILDKKHKIRIIDPAVGDGELLLSLIKLAHDRNLNNLEVFGCDISQDAVNASQKLISENFPSTSLRIEKRDFLEWVLDFYNESLFSPATEASRFDIVIANPPYVRTQVMGSEKAKRLAKQFNLSGRVDLYHAFLKGIEKILKSNGILGIIVSNRFLTTKSGVTVRKNLLSSFNILHVWDFGDTRLFEAAVLPAVLLLEKAKGMPDEVHQPKFTSIYLQEGTKNPNPTLVFNALAKSDGDLFKVLHGTLDHGKKHGDVWRLATQQADDWLEQVRSKTKLTFKDIGKIRVGIKTTADNVFILSDADMEKFSGRLPEILQPLITHHVARRFKANEPIKYVIYPHEVKDGVRKAIDLAKFPIVKKYLESHKKQLASRTYIAESNRNWFEIWVPHNPDAWKQPKLVFRDISEKPVFWMDLSGSVVNGDCYWLSLSDKKESDLLWLALAVANSSFIEEFYDHSFNNKLYSGRRRFITQYVENFPLPNPDLKISKEIVVIARQMYKISPSAKTNDLEAKLNSRVYMAFGLNSKKSAGKGI
jgi:adenine-specific DNA-methyltransferase